MRLAITMGDPAGIGAEIIIKALSHVEVYQKCIPVVIGDYEALADAIQFCHLPLELKEVHDVTEGRGEFGRVDFINKGFLEKGGWEVKMKNTKKAPTQQPGERSTAQNDEEEEMLLLARHMEPIPEEDRKELKEQFKKSIDMYLKAMGLSETEDK